MMGVEEHSTGEEVGSSALRGKPRKLVVRPKEGDVLVGRCPDDDWNFSKSRVLVSTSWKVPK